MYDAGDRRHIREAEKAAKLAEVQSHEQIRAIMGTTAGRAWISSKLALAFTTPFTEDPHTTAFNCGQQNIALSLLADVIAATPDQFILMMREANERSTAAEQRRSQRADRRIEAGTSEFGSDGSAEAGGDYDPTAADRTEAERST